jgi:hypothetical protein
MLNWKPEVETLAVNLTNRKPWFISFLVSTDIIIGNAISRIPYLLKYVYYDACDDIKT